jgi:hypothetical protein
MAMQGKKTAEKSITQGTNVRLNLGKSPRINRKKLTTLFCQWQRDYLKKRKLGRL